MDAMEQIVSECELCAAVLGKDGEFVLVPLGESGPLPDATVQLVKERGYLFAGVMGYDGQVRVQAVMTRAAADTLKLACGAFARYLTHKLRPQQDSGEWLERLWELNDERGDA